MKPNMGKIDKQIRLGIAAIIIGLYFMKKLNIVIPHKTLNLLFMISLPTMIAPTIFTSSIAYANEPENQRNGGEGYSEAKMQKKLADDLQTLSAPDSFRTNIISTLGLWVGGAVGEVRRLRSLPTVHPVGLPVCAEQGTPMD